MPVFLYLFTYNQANANLQHKSETALEASLIYESFMNMKKSKSSKLWVVNVASFVLFATLVTTGMTNWLLLPRGYGARGGFLISLRHFFRDVHEWTAVLFIIIIAIHIGLHWSYIQTNLRKRD